MNPKISIVIPTYRHLSDCLKPAIESIIKYTDLINIEIIIVCNGCGKDGTKEYVESLGEPFRLLWFDEPLGYPKATNEGIKAAKGDYIVLLNNDVILLEQPKNKWLEMLEEPFKNPWLGCGVSGPIKGFSNEAGKEFIVFFCAMIKKDVFTRTGFLNEIYGQGGGEDTEFCAEAVKFGYKLIQVPMNQATDWEKERGLVVGGFPIFHVGEKTMNDDREKWIKVFEKNGMILGKKYKSDWYRWKISNNCERAIFFPKDEIYPREKTRYEFAANNIVGKKVLELGCSNGYGTRLLPKDIDYTGVDYDQTSIDEATRDYGDANHKFICADVNKFDLGQYDTIIVFEFLEHIDNGKELAQELKKHCKCLLITTPYKEPVGMWGSHHKLHGLSEEDFPGFEYKYITLEGQLTDEPDMRKKIIVDGVEKSENLIIMKWTDIY